MTVPVEHLSASIYLLSRGLDMGQARVCLVVAKRRIWARRDFVIYMDQWLKKLKFVSE